MMHKSFRLAYSLTCRVTFEISVLPLLIASYMTLYGHTPTVTMLITTYDKYFAIFR